MVLDAVLRLDAAGFTTPLGIATMGVQALLRMAGEMAAELAAAFDTGGMLSDLAAQTGEAAGELMVMRQAFQDTGLGAESMAQTLAIMRRSLGGISETGEPTVKMFEQLGLDIGKLQGMGAREQLEAIGAAVNGLRTPAEQSAAAMTIFGRSGARMLTLLKDPAAMGVAAKSLGALPGLMDRNAAAFDTVSDRMGRIKEKGNGLWAGIAEGLLPLADSITQTMDGIDLTGLGQKIGATIGTVAEGFKVAADYWREVFGVAIDWWGDKIAVAMTWWKEQLPAIGRVLWDVLKWPVVQLSAAIGKVIQEAMELVGRIPVLGEKAGLKGFEADSWAELKAQASEDIDAEFKMVGSAIVYGIKSIGDAVQETAQSLHTSFQNKLTAIQERANAAGVKGFGGAELQATKEAKEPARRETRIDTDALARIGGYLGGGGRTMEGLAMRTARATEALVRLAEGSHGGRAVWLT